MLPETHPLIEVITQPLADNAEMQLSAVHILEQSFDPEHPSVPPAMERIKARDKKKLSALGKIVIWISALAILGFSIYTDRDAILTVFNFDDLLYYGHNESVTAPNPTGLTEQQLLLLGDSTLDALTQKRLLFESDPTNPAYFAEYAQEYSTSNDSLPPDFLEIAERIDPGNSFFVYWYAGQIGGESVEKLSLSKSSIKSKPAPRFVGAVELRPLPIEAEYKIKDRAAYDASLELIKKASEMPRFESYVTNLMTARARIIKGDTLSDYKSMLIMCFGSSAHGIFSILKVSRVMEARAEELSKAGRKDEFISLASQREALILGLSQNKDIYLSSESVYAGIAFNTATNFEASAWRLDLSEMAGKYRLNKEAFTDERDLRQLRDDGAIEELVMNRSSILTRLASPINSWLVQDPPPLRASDIKPMRMVEHELLGRLGLISAALILLPTTLFILLFRFFTPKVIRLPAKRIACLLKPTDWIWIFVLGIALPILVFLYINRFSPVSGRDYGSSHFLFIFPGLHLSALLLTLLLAPAIVTRWRLTRRAAAFKFGSRLDLLSLPVIGVMLVYAVVAYPVIVKISNLNTMVQIGLAAPLVGWLGFVFFNGLRIFLGSARSRIIQTATAIAVIPAYPLAIIALCLVLSPYREGEKYWLSQDKLHLIDPDAPDLGAYEFKVAAQKRKEINEIMGIE